MVREVRRDGSSEVLNLLAERIRQPRNRRMLIRMVKF
jgi:hypothetical protein